MGTNYGSRTVTWMDPNLHPGYVLNWNTTVEYQISANNLLKLAYPGSAGVHLVESWNINAFPTGFRRQRSGAADSGVRPPQNYLPYPQFGASIRCPTPATPVLTPARSSIRSAIPQGLVLNSFYTFSKALDDCDTDYGICTGVGPWTNRNLNKGRAGYDMRHRFVTSASTNSRSAKAGAS